jgi:hypothetical protein
MDIFPRGPPHYTIGSLKRFPKVSISLTNGIRVDGGVWYGGVT